MVLDRYERRFPVDSKLLNKIKSEFISGEKTLQEAADEYKVPYSTLTKKSHEGKWKELRKECGKKTERKIIETVSANGAKKAVDIIDVADKLLEKASELMEMPLTTQSFKQLTSALKDLKEIKGYKSDADIREQEARIAKLQKEAQEEKEDKDITVVFGSDTEDYSL
jgi:hypothetical protein